MMVYNVFINILSVTGKLSVWTVLMKSEALCSPPCSADMFACASGLKCVSKKVICDFAGYDHCGDNSDESESLCTPPCSNVRLR